MKMRTLCRLALPAAALAALITVPVTQNGKKPVLGIQQAPLAASITPGTGSGSTATDRVVAFNDIHGYLQSGTAGSLYGQTAGGARQFTREFEQLENSAPSPGNVSAVGSGDLVGASPLISGGFDDEPTIDMVHALNIDYTSVGNHEFDHGLTELKRQQDGGCNLTSGNTASAGTVSSQCTFTYSDNQDSQAAGQFTGLGTANASDQPSQAYDDAGITTGYLAANVVPITGAGTTEDAAHSNPANYPAPIFPAYGVKTFPNGTKVGYIGEVLSGTPGIVTASGVQNLAFLDEATTANYYANQLKAQGVNTIVLLIHQGGAQGSPQQGQPTPSVDTCSGFNGDIQPILQNLNSSISVVVSGHTHQAYDCALSEPSGTKLVTSAAKYNQALTSIDLTINKSDDSLVSAAAKNATVTTPSLTYEGTTTAAADQCTPVSVNTNTPSTAPAGTNDPLYFHVRNIECAAESEAAAKSNNVVGDISGNILRSNTGPSGSETQAGDLIADAQLYDAKMANPNVVAAFMNEGGVRNDLLYNPANNPAQPGQVTYGEAFQVQPFGDVLTDEDLTGAQILTILQEQFRVCNPGQGNGAEYLLQGAGITYTLNFNSSTCAGLFQNVIIGGAPLDPTRTYTIEANNFLVGGGDGFPGFEVGQNQTPGDVDIDALNNYLGQSLVPGAAPVPPPTPNRVQVIGSLSSFNPGQPGGALPETPFAVGLPLAALAIAGGFYFLRRRRNARRAA